MQGLGFWSAKLHNLKMVLDMKLDLAAARKEQARLAALYHRNHPHPGKVTSRLVFKPDARAREPKDFEPKYVTERPYLPQNRRCKRFAAN